MIHHLIAVGRISSERKQRRPGDAASRLPCHEPPPVYPPSMMSGRLSSPLAGGVTTRLVKQHRPTRTGRILGATAMLSTAQVLKSARCIHQASFRGSGKGDGVGFEGSCAADRGAATDTELRVGSILGTWEGEGNAS